jgi:hypothetical protein
MTSQKEQSEANKSGEIELVLDIPPRKKVVLQVDTEALEEAKA